MLDSSDISQRSNYTKSSLNVCNKNTAEEITVSQRHQARKAGEPIQANFPGFFNIVDQSRGGQAFLQWDICQPGTDLSHTDHSRFYKSNSFQLPITLGYYYAGLG